MSGFFSWTPAGPVMVEDEYAQLVTGASWTGYTPADPSSFQVVLSETINPRATDHYEFRPGYLHQGHPFEYAANEVFYQGTKVADVADNGLGQLTLGFTAHPQVSDYGALAAGILQDLWYANTTELALGSYLVQQMQLRFIDNGLVVSEANRLLTIRGVDDEHPPVPLEGSGQASGLEGETIAVTVSATDPDAGDSVSHFRIETLPVGGAFYTSADGTTPLTSTDVILATGGSATIYFRADDPEASGDFSFGYIVSDGSPFYSPLYTGQVTVLPVDDGVTLDGGNGADLLHGSPDADTLRGGNGADVLHGHGGADVLEGGNGDDTLWGGRGDDVLRGGRGGDLLSGGQGSDSLWGGQGADLFSFGAGTQAGDLDRIEDFSVGVDGLKLNDGLAIASTQWVGADTLITLSNGAQVQLVGVAWDPQAA